MKKREYSDLKMIVMIRTAKRQKDEWIIGEGRHFQWILRFVEQEE